MKASKLLSRFERNGENISRVMNTNFSTGERNLLPYWDGIHTIRLEGPEQHGESLAVRPLLINDNTVFKGYLESTDARVIHFISNKRKLVKNISNSYYHAIADDIAEIIVAHKMYPEAEFVIGVGDVINMINTPHMNFFLFFLSCLEKKKIKYTLVDFTKFDLVYIDNFSDLVFPFHSGARLDLLSEFFEEFVSNKSQEAYRKVYVSRKGSGWKEDHKDAVNFPYKNDNRIDSHDKIEDLFRSLGFEIVYPEEFASFQEQLDFFHSVKTIASLTSSGMTNAIFMKPGGLMLEIVTPLITKSPHITDFYLAVNQIDKDQYAYDPGIVQEIHMFYHNLAFFKEHLYVAIPNNERDTDKIADMINLYPRLKDLINE